MFRQGDVLLVEVEKIPDNSKQIITQAELLAKGEFSDHGHYILTENTAEDLDFYEDILWNGTVEKYVMIKSGSAILKHLSMEKYNNRIQEWTGEHKDIEIPGNKIYQIIRQREYDPFDDASRIVVD